jgi:hypothetical protein
LFIATHSEDVLHGLLAAEPGKLRIIRLERRGIINKVRELERVLAEKVSSDPLMRFTSVLSGVFHHRVIICESDADCMFYSSILDLPDVHGKRHPDVLFVQAGGKHRMPMLAETLRALDVNVDVIVDIDILSDVAELKRIVTVLGGNGAGIEVYAKRLKAAIEQTKLWRDANETASEIQSVLGKSQEPGSLPQRVRDQIRGVLRYVSPWDDIKRAGYAAIPAGDATQHYQKLQSLCESCGLWIVPVGELEGFCKSQGGHGPRWVQEVLERYDLTTSVELSTAREFVRKIWQRIET